MASVGHQVDDASGSPGADELPQAGTGLWRGPLRALRHRDFRLFLFGQVISLSGTWMQSLAVSWLIYRLTHSAAMMGLVGFIGQIPVLVLGPIAGLAADRHPRRRIILCTQALLMLQSAILAALALSGSIKFVHIAALSLLSGLVNAFDIPARQSLYIRLVGKDDLLSAISLNSVTFNSARIVGPSIAGFLVAALGEGPCFLINSVSFLPVLASILVMRAAEPVRRPAESALANLRDGLRYAWSSHDIRGFLGLTAAANLACAPALVLAPVIADAVFHQGSQGLGLLTGAFGVGAVIGTLTLAARDRPSHLRTIFFSALQLALALALYAWSPAFAVSLCAAGLIGYAVMRQLAATNTEIQSRIDDAFRGRVMAMYSMVVVGMLPIGNLLGGAIAEIIGVRWTIFTGALLCLAAVLLWRRSLPPGRFHRSKENE